MMVVMGEGVEKGELSMTKKSNSEMKVTHYNCTLTKRHLPSHTLVLH